MASLFDLLSQQTPTLKVKKGLIVLDLQNDFISPTGKLTVRDTRFLDPLSELVRTFPAFGDVIWVRSQFESTRPINGTDTDGDTVVAGGSSGKEAEMESTDDVESSQNKTKKSETSQFTESLSSDDDGENDEELFLSRTSNREPCCLRGSHGAEYFGGILPLIQPGKHMELVKTHYSAFSGTSLLLTLRGKLITELFICGCLTNLSVYATAMDAARYGIKVTLVDDCLGYRRQVKHDTAIKQLREFMEASIMSSTQILRTLRGPQAEEDHSEIVVGEGPRRHNDLSALEADSDDSDEEDEDESEEVQQPIPSRLFDRRVEARFMRTPNKYSPRVLEAMRERKACPEYAQSSSSHPGKPSDPAEPTTSAEANQARHGRYDNLAKKLDSPHSDGGQLDSHDSSYKEPWIDLIPPDESSSDIPQPNHPVLAAMTAAAALSSSTVAGIEEMMRRANMQESPPSEDAMMGKPLFGVDKEEESDGSCILQELLPPDIAQTVFDQLNKEVGWQKMYHLVGEVPRLVCCQGTMGDDGSMPVYRHPSDNTIPLQKWTPTVDMVRKAAEKAVGHPLNHVLIQLYRSGTDFISEHSDKTLDIVPDSNIVNVSFGAQRTMRLRTKRGAPTSEPNGARITYRVPMPHNSMITMSLRTNAQYLHGINADKRPRCELVESEKAFDGQRISCTFRQIGTFISEDSGLIWGQGAFGKTQQEAREVINGDADQSERMVRAFGAENAASTIEWQQIYGEGFDVLHLKAIQGLRATTSVTPDARQ